MKILPILLINLVVVGGGLVIYDQMRADTPQAAYATDGLDGVELADIKSRLGRLEGAGQQPAETPPQAEPAALGGGRRPRLRARLGRPGPRLGGLGSRLGRRLCQIPSTAGVARRRATPAVRPRPPRDRSRRR